MGTRDIGYMYGTTGKFDFGPVYISGGVYATESGDQIIQAALGSSF